MSEGIRTYECQLQKTASYRKAPNDKLKLLSYIDFKKVTIPMNATGIFIDVGNPHILINSEKPNSQFLGYVKDLQTKDSSFLDFNISQYKKISKTNYWR